jgi:hypothetical protein
MKIYFNRSFSATSHSINALKQTWRHEPLEVIVSHGQRDRALDRSADVFTIEPKFEGEAYLEWILSHCQKHDVRFFLPRKNVLYLSRYRDRFEALGIEGMWVTCPETYELLNDKNRANQDVISSGIVSVPHSCVVENYEDFMTHYESIRAHGDEACIKPVAGIGGKGFKRIKHDLSEYDELKKGSPISISFQRLERCLRTAQRFKPLLLATYLKGREYSVDCLAYEGELISATPRRYVGKREQVVERVETLIESCAALTRRWSLSYLFNIQFRQHRKEWHFIEINTRMAAGSHRLTTLGVHQLPNALELLSGRAPSHPLDVPWGQRVYCREDYFTEPLEESSI